MVIHRVTPNLSRNMSFKCSAAVDPGNMVDITAANTVTKAGATDGEYIGIVKFDAAHTAVNDDAGYTVGDVVPVLLRAEPIVSTTAAPVAIGDFVKLAASGQITVEATAGTKTLNSIGIALTAGDTDAEIKFVPF
jgi:hypothetical protein